MFHGNKDVCNDNANGHGPGLVLQKDHFLTEIVTNPKINVYALCLTMSSLKVNKKKLCYKCGGNFHSRHQCPDHQLRVMLIDDDDEEER